MRSTQWFRLGALIAVVVLVAACSGGGASSATSTTAATAPVNPADESDGHRRTGRNFHSCGEWRGPTHLSMEKEWCDDCQRNRKQLLDGSRDSRRQWRHIHGHGQ